MFSTQEAVSFLQDTWGVQRVQQRFYDDNNRKALLDEIVKSIQAHVPFQSVTLMAVPPEQRKRPSVEQIKRECMTGIGGLCYNTNVFTWGLLQGVGFDALLCASSVVSPGDHVVVIVCDLQNEGDVHLVECGFGFPTFRAIDLMFYKESPVFVDSFLEYKYVTDKEGRYARMHGADKIKVKIIEAKFVADEGSWSRFYSFKLNLTKNVSELDAGFDKVLTVLSLHSPMALAYPDGKAVILVNDKLMVETEGGEMETTVLDGDQAIVDKYHSYFPSLPEDVVRRALNEWRSLKQQ